MFKSCLFLFVLCVTRLFSHIATTENEPNSLIEGIVSAVTGDVYVFEEDVIIQGAEPLRIKRSYVSNKGQGTWCYFTSLSATLYPLAHELFVWEPNGTGLYYRYKPEKSKKARKQQKKEGFYPFRPLDLNTDGKGLTNTARGNLSARTNLKNQYVTIDEKILTVHCPDGTKRLYKKCPHQKSLEEDITTIYEFRLWKETLPNGNLIIYTYKDDASLHIIRTTDPNEQRTYAQAVFTNHGKIRKNKHGEKYLDCSDFHINTSDGRELHYGYIPYGKPEKGGKWVLHKMTSPDKPEETLHYFPPANNRGPILSAMAFPQSRDLHISYHEPDRSNPLYCCVKTLSSPVGPDATPIVTHQFNYDFSQRKTTVTDIEGIPTHYFWDDQLRLTGIDRYITHDKFHNAVHFVWGNLGTSDAANLLCKIVFDEHRTPLYATRYIYDPSGNVIQEKFYGNLSGQGSPLVLDPNQFPIENGVEVAITNRTYSQDDKHLLLREEAPNGLVTTYEYLPQTNLPTKILYYENGTIRKRHFTFYDNYRIPICEISDDGNTPEPNDLQNVATRQIRRAHPYTHSCYIGMPHIIEELYWNGKTECLLKKTVLTYTTGGKIAKKEIHDSNNQYRYSLDYTYDQKGRLLTETDAEGRIAKTQYDELGNPIFFQDFGSRYTSTMKYDYSNRLIETRESAENLPPRITSHRYNTYHQQIASTDFHQYETLYTYDRFDHPIQTQLPPVNNTHPTLFSSYDSQGYELTRTDPKGFTTLIEYNSRGLPIHIQHPDQTHEWNTYDLSGRLQSYLNQNGIETLYAYDVFDRVVSITIKKESEVLSEEKFIYDAFHLTAKTNAEGHTTTYEYDGAGRLIAERTGKEQTFFSYDSLNRPSIIQTGDLLTLSEFDLLDRVIEERKEDTQGNLFSKVQYAYDSAGDQITTTRFISNLPAIETFTYDPFHRLICQEDPLGNQTHTLYDDLNHQQTNIDPIGLQIRQTFNSHYQLEQLEKYTSNGSFLLQENFTYDINDNLILKETRLADRSLYTQWEYGPLNRLAHLTEALNTSEQRTSSYLYTPTGKPHKTIKPSGITLTSTYDPLDHLLTQSSSDGSIQYTYYHDRLGHLLTSTDHTRQTTLIRSYDPKGRLLSETFPSRHDLKNTYDNQGRRIQLQLPDNSRIIYAYDALYLRSISRPGYTHSFTTYDLAENLLSQQLAANYGTLSHTYDPLNRITSCSAPHFHQIIYSYDPIGNLLESERNGQYNRYTYDPLYQLTSENNHTYAYDPLYNRLKKDDISYTPNPLNQLPDQFTYDPDGNPISHGDAHYAYDALDRLIAITLPNKCLEFTYDSYHRRLTKTCRTQGAPPQTTFYLYDDQNEIGTIDAAGNLLELRILGESSQAEIGSAVAMELNGQLFIPIHDLHGNIALLLSQGIAEEYHYSAFGEPLSSGTLSPWRFCSKRIDPETGFVYFGRRYYIPSLGRWLTPDPLGYEPGPNLYAYVSNAPLTHVDLYGLFDTWEMKNFIKETSRRQMPDTDYKQLGIGAMHGVGDFALRAGTGMSTIGWGLTTPFRSINWFSGKSSFSEDWNNFSQSNEAFFQAGNRWMNKLFPANTQNSSYQLARNSISTGIELGTLASTGYGLGTLGVKSFSFAKNAFKIPSQTAVQESFQLNRLQLLQNEKNFKPFIKNNYRSNLKELTGMNPSCNIHAHHVFVQQLERDFFKKGINIHDPKYLTWWERSSHLPNAKSYGAEWINFMTRNPNATKQQILEKGRGMMNKYGIDVNY